MDRELQVAVEEVMRSINVFKEGQRADREEIKALREYLEKLEAKQGRPGFGSEFASRAEVETERKNLNCFIRGDYKSMTVSIDPQAGYLVPSILQPSVISKQYDPPTLLSLVRTEQWDGPGSAWLEPLKRAFTTARRREVG